MQSRGPANEGFRPAEPVSYVVDLTDIKFS